MTLLSLVKRNGKMFFKDKGLFFTSLITPVILLVLYVTFLGNVYRDSFAAPLNGATLDSGLVDSLVAGQLVSSLLAVCCVTVAFCSNMLMVQDKISGARYDFSLAPIKQSTLALGYYISTALSTLFICYVAMGAGFIYVASNGWYLTVGDAALVTLDVFLLVMFGTALSSVINFFLSSQGQISAVGTVVSSAYGFICGAYMPISQFGEGLQKALIFLPGTHGTSLLRCHFMSGTFGEMARAGLPEDIITRIKDAVDCNIYFFGNEVGNVAKLCVLGGGVLLCVCAYVLLNMLVKVKKK